MRIRNTARLPITLCLGALLGACSEERVDLTAVDTNRFVVPSGPPSVQRQEPGPAASDRRATLPVPSMPTLTPVEPREMVDLTGLPTRATPPPPISGGTLAVAADGSIAVAADPDRDVVYLVEVFAENVRTVSLPMHSEPGRVLLDDSGSAHVVLRSAGMLARIELSSAQATLSPKLCQHPRGIAHDPKAGALLVGCADGDLIELDAKTYAVRTRHQFARDLRDVVISVDGTRYLSRFRSAELLRLNTNDTQHIKPRTLPLPAADTVSGVRWRKSSATLASRTIAAPDGMLWMLHQRALDTEIDLADGYDDSHGCSPVVQPSLTGVNSNGEVSYSLRLPAASALSVDVAIAPSGKWLAIAAPGTYTASRASVSVLSYARLLTEARIPEEADEPRELSDFVSQYCNGTQAIELGNSTEATAVAFDANGLLYVQGRFPAQLEVASLDGAEDSATKPGSAHTLRKIMLARDDVRDLGHELFHSAISMNGLSCSSCHGEAQDDGHVWSFKDVGPRRTPDLRGGVLDTLPLHWDGSLPDFAALMREQAQVRMHAQAVPGRGIDAVAQWLHKLPALQLQPADEAAAKRGETLFASATLGCSGCHTGPALSNNKTVDVGTGAPFQVPSLRGLGLRAPLMHDGCAADIADIFKPGCGGDERHTRVMQLSAADQSDLRSYLDSL